MSDVLKIYVSNAGIRLGLEFIDSLAASIFRSPSHQPLSAVSSVPDAQLANEPTLALCQAAKPNFTPQRLFHWIQLGGPARGHCPQQAPALHELCVWKIMILFDILFPPLFLLQNKQCSHDYHQGIMSSLDSYSSMFKCCSYTDSESLFAVWLTLNLWTVIASHCHSSVLSSASERGRVPRQEFQDEQVGFTNIFTNICVW